MRAAQTPVQPKHDHRGKGTKCTPLCPAYSYRFTMDVSKFKPLDTSTPATVEDWYKDVTNKEVAKGRARLRKKAKPKGPLAAESIPLMELADRVMYPTGSDDERTEDAVVLAQRVKSLAPATSARRHPKSVRPHIEQLDGFRQWMGEMGERRMLVPNARDLHKALNWLMPYLASPHTQHFDGCPALPDGPGVELTQGETGDLINIMSMVASSLVRALALYAKRPRPPADSAAAHELAEALNAVRCWSTFAGKPMRNG